MPAPDVQAMPQDTDAEMALLGSMMVERSVVDGVRPIVSREAFATPQHALIFDALLAVFDRGDPMDLLALIGELRSRRQLEEIGGQEYLIQLAESFCDWANAEFYARQVRTAYQRRRLLALGIELQKQAGDPMQEPEAFIGHVADLLEQIEAQGRSDRDAVAEAELLRAMSNPAEDEADRVPVALGSLGDLLDGGLDRATLTVVGGRPSTGKTSLGLGLALHAATSPEGCRVLFVSAEMSCEQVAQRLVSMRSGLEVHRVRSGDVDDARFNSARNEAALDAEASVNAGRGLYVLEGVTDVRAIVSHVRRWVRKENVGLVVVDYLGRLDIAGRFDRHDLRLAAMTKAFKDCAVQARVAMVLLVQLSRAHEKESRRPTLADLRDSGAIEADADNAILIWRGNYEHDGLCDTTLILAKQRQGRTGDCPVWYRQGTMTYAASL